MIQIDYSEALKLPYVSEKPQSDGRTILSLGYFDYENKDWSLFFPIKKQNKYSFQRMQGGETVSGLYFAKKPAEMSKDFYWKLGTFISHYASYPKIVTAMEVLYGDFVSMAAAIEKYSLIFNNESYSNSEKSTLIQVELENLFVLVRSYYDSLHKVTVHFSKHIKQVDDQDKNLMANIPEKSFAKIALDGDSQRTAIQMVEKWNLLMSIAEFYQTQSQWFLDIREVRNSLMHHGKKAPYVFILPEGAAIDVSEGRWNNYSFYAKNDLLQEKFLSVESLFAQIIKHAIDATDHYISAITEGILFPKSYIDKEVKLFIRGPFLSHLNNLEEIIKRAWED